MHKPLWPMERVHACPLCGSESATVTFEKSMQGIPLTFVKCTQCSLIYQSPRFTRDGLADYFSSKEFINDTTEKTGELLGYPDYFDWDRSYTPTHKRRVAQIAHLKPPPGALLEIGTATGSFLNAARAAGYQVRGLDLSRRLAEIARRTHGLDIDLGYVEEAPLPGAGYDVVCNFGGIACWRDPLLALSNIRQTLKPDGLFVFNHFDIDGIMARILGKWHFEYNHASLILYSERTMNECLRRSGFEIVRSQTEVQLANLSRVLGYLRLGTATKLARKLKIADVLFPMPAPGTLLVVARPV